MEASDTVKWLGVSGRKESGAVALQAFMFSSLGDTDVSALISVNNELRGAVLSSASFRIILNDFLSPAASPLSVCLSVHRVASRSPVKGSGS